MVTKAKIGKKSVQKAIREAATLEEAALILGVDRRTLYDLRVQHGLKVATRA